MKINIANLTVPEPAALDRRSLATNGTQEGSKHKHMNRYTLLSIFLLLSTLQVSAQEPEPKKQPFILKGLYWVKTLIDSSAVSGVDQGLYWVKTLIDSSAVSGVDRSYIEQPKRPWAVEVRTDASETTLKMHLLYLLGGLDRLSWLWSGVVKGIDRRRWNNFLLGRDRR